MKETVSINSKNYFDIAIDDKILNDESIYTRFAKTIAKVVDIEIAKTPLGDLLEGYIDNKINKKRIEKAIEYIESLKMNAPDEKALDILLELLEGENYE